MNTAEEEEHKKSEKLAYCWIRCEYEQQYNVNVPQVLKRLTSFFTRKIIPSSLLTIKEDMALSKKVEQQLPLYIARARFLFRASENNFRSEAFHNVCDNNDLLHQLVVVKSNWGNVFGACTMHSFGPSVQDDITAFCGRIKTQNMMDANDETFLFLNRSDDEKLQQKIDDDGPIIFNMNPSKSKWAVWCYDIVGPTFGDGFDLYIADKCNQIIDGEFRNTTKLSTFTNPDVSEVSLCGGSLKVQGGHSFVFSVVEYEVFELMH